MSALESPAELARRLYPNVERKELRRIERAIRARDVQHEAELEELQQAADADRAAKAAFHKSYAENGTRALADVGSALAVAHERLAAAGLRLCPPRKT